MQVNKYEKIVKGDSVVQIGTYSFPKVTISTWQVSSSTLKIKEDNI